MTLTSSPVREIERKYESRNGADAISLSILDNLAGVGPGVVDRFRLTATYYDTESLALATAGVTLRRRTGGDDAGWHVKLPRGRDTRLELRLPLTATAHEVPAEFAELVRALARRAPLVPVARIETDRMRQQLLDPGGQELAEVVVDHVCGEDLRAGGRVRRWSEVEVEVELGAGPPELLDVIERRLLGARLRRSPAPSKLARVLDATPDSGPALGAHPTAAEVVGAYVTTQIAAIVHHDIGIRRDEPDAVHRARVAIRRLRSTFRVFDGVLDRAATRPLDGELRWLGNELGAARDVEVQRERFAAIPPELIVGPVTERVTAHFNRRQRAAASCALAALDSERYLRLLDALDRLVAQPPTAVDAGRPAGEVLAGVVRHACAAVRRDLRAAAARSTDADRDAALHRARRAGKRARYAMEVAGLRHPHRVRRGAAVAARFQDLIGEYQDSVVARAVLTELAREAEASGEPSFTYGRLYEREAAVTARIAPGLRGAWQEVEHAARPLFQP